MAELGTIQHVDVNAGTRPIDRSGELRAIGEGLQHLKAGVDKGVSIAVTGEMLDSLEEAVQDSTVFQNDTSVIWKPGSPEAFISNRFDKLQHVIGQGKTSQVTKAKMEIQQLLAQAQTKYPWLADDLQQKAGQIIAGSAAMTQLGLDDEARSTQAALAQDEYDRLLEYGYDDQEDGKGLGIPRYLKPGDPAYQRMWADREEQAQVLRAVRTRELMDNARGSLSADEWVQKAQDYTIGAKSPVVIEMAQVENKSLLYDVLREQAKPVPDQRKIEAWRVNNGPLLITELQNQLAGLRQYAQTVPSNVLQSERGARVNEIFEASAAMIESRIQMVQGFIDGIPGAATRLSTAALIRDNEREQAGGNTNQATNDWMQTPGAEALMKLATGNADVASILMQHGMGKYAQSEMARLFPDEFNTGDLGLEGGALFRTSDNALQIPAYAPASQILDKIRATFMDDGQSFILPTNSQAQREVMALHNADTHMLFWKNAKAVNEMSNPTFASNTLQGLTYSLVFLGQRPEAAPADVPATILPMLADPETLEAVNVALNDPNIGKRQAFAQAADEYYQKSGYYERRVNVGQEYKNGQVRGLNIADVAKIKPEPLEKGKIEWEYDDDVIAIKAKELVAQSPVGSGVNMKGKVDQMKRKIKMELQEKTMKFTDEVNQQINIEIMLNKASAGTEGPVVEGDWAAHFLGVGDKGGERTAWVNFFNYAAGNVTRSQ